MAFAVLVAWVGGVPRILAGIKDAALPPFAIFFGNHPIWLPFDASDPYNAAFWLADLELAFPVAVADRWSVPLFPGDDADLPLAFSMADTVFYAVAMAGLGATRAAMLSLHSGRVFCACALLAQGAPRPMILALCRWRDERSLDVYARPSAAEYGVPRLDDEGLGGSG